MELKMLEHCRTVEERFLFWEYLDGVAICPYVSVSKMQKANLQLGMLKLHESTWFRGLMPDCHWVLGGRSRYQLGYYLNVYGV